MCINGREPGIYIYHLTIREYVIYIHDVDDQLCSYTTVFDRFVSAAQTVRILSMLAITSSLECFNSEQVSAP